MSVEISVKELLEAGAHFGHQISRWNPKMRPFIFQSRGGIHILDLDQTAKFLKAACQFVTANVAQGGHLLFVGTKKQAKLPIEEESKRSGQYYVSNRWLGGMLTNFKTIKASITRLETLEKKVEEPDFEKYTKKERLTVRREIEKLNAIFGGIKTMDKIPTAMFVVDPKNEQTAVKEAQRLNIPVVAIVDSNCNPDGIDFLIPANDDAIRSIQVITQAIADAALAGAEKYQAVLAKQQASQSQIREVKPSTPPVREKKMEKKGRAFVGGKKGEKETASVEDVKQFASAKAQGETE